MARPALQIGFHDHCFDGSRPRPPSSGSTATRYGRARLEQVAFRGLAHRPGSSSARKRSPGKRTRWSTRYTRDPRLTWWFDTTRAQFESRTTRPIPRDTSGRKFWTHAKAARASWRASAGIGSAGISRRSAELVDWAEVIGRSAVPDAKSAVELTQPAMQLISSSRRARTPSCAAAHPRALGAATLRSVARALGAAAARAAARQHRRRWCGW